MFGKFVNKQRRPAGLFALKARVVGPVDCLRGLCAQPTEAGKTCLQGAVLHDKGFILLEFGRLGDQRITDNDL